MLKKKIKKWTVVIDNKMRDLGETDWNKKRIRINKKRSKIEGKGELLKTLIHENLHQRHPKMTEKIVERKTQKIAKKVTQKRKSKIYSKLNKR